MNLDPMTQYDEAEALQRQDEAIREQRWTAFVDFVKRASVPVLLRHVADLLQGQRDPYMVNAWVQHELDAFADEEGWHGVLTAIAVAMREAQTELVEVERRR